MADLEIWRKRNSAIRAHSVELYEALWSEIKSHTDQAARKGFLVTTGGRIQKEIRISPEGG
jgi:hypothetical protein